MARKSLPRLAAALRALTASALLLGGASAHAALINGGFETGLLGWETLGDVSVQTAAIGTTPTEGSSQAFLSTLCDRTLPSPYPPGCQITLNELPYSDVNAVATTGSYFTNAPLFDWLGIEYLQDVLPLGIVEVNGEGSGLKQEFFGLAGNTLTFDYNYITAEAAGQSTDPALLSLVLDAEYYSMTLTALLGGGALGAPVLLSDVPLCERIVAPEQPGGDLCQTPFFETLESGYHTFSLVLPYTGIYTLGFSVFERAEGNVPTVLSIDNVNVVPEPSTITLLGIGLALFGLTARRREAGRVTGAIPAGLWRR